MPFNNEFESQFKSLFLTTGVGPVRGRNDGPALSIKCDRFFAMPVYPVESALRKIHGQHRNVARVLAALREHAEACARGDAPADFALMDSMLGYVYMFCERIHHPTEEEFLFAALRRQKAPERMTAQAAEQHVLGTMKLNALRDALDLWRDRPDARSEGFLAQTADYLSFQFDHMSYEERVILPCAVDTLPADDWQLISDAFLAQNDPLFGPHLTPELTPLRELLSVGQASH